MRNILFFNSGLAQVSELMNTWCYIRELWAINNWQIFLAQHKPEQMQFIYTVQVIGCDNAM